MFRTACGTFAALTKFDLFIGYIKSAYRNSYHIPHHLSRRKKKHSTGLLTTSAKATRPTTARLQRAKKKHIPKFECTLHVSQQTHSHCDA